MVGNASDLGTVRYPRCPSCGTFNAEGALTCSRCGTSLQGVDVRPPSGAESAAPNQVICSNCHKTIPAGSKFCGYCGKSLVGAVPATNAASPAERISHPPEPLRPVFVPPASPVPPPPEIPAPPPAPPRAVTPLPAVPVASEAVPPELKPSQVETETEADATIAFRGFRLRKIEASVTELKPDGTDGKTVTIAQEASIGRENCTVTYPEDAMLSPSHASLAIRDGRMYLKDLQSQNGTFLRQQEDAELTPGDVFLLGRDLFRFTMQPSENNQSSDHTHLMTGPPILQREPVTARLEHIQLSGEAIEEFGLERPETTLGRTRGDLIFKDDPYMSATHARILAQPGRFVLQDLKSKNGVYRKIRSEVELKDADQFFLGEQLFRVQVKTIQP